MGGFGSGRTGGRPTADASLHIDIAWMLRTDRAKVGCHYAGSLSWTCRGEAFGSISYEADMTDIENARLVLRYTRGTGDRARKVRQEIRLTYTEPNFGGRRWWMICPSTGSRCGKLYLPPSGDQFASRKAWRLGYHSQRIAARDQPFETLFRLQRKLGGQIGWEMGLAMRPKGMWHRTYDKFWQEYFRLDAHCSAEMNGVLARL